MANPKIIKPSWKGSGSGVPLARAMTTVGRTLQGMRMESGECLQKRAGRLVIPSSVVTSISFSGTAYIAGNKTTGLKSDNTKPWVRCFLDSATAEEHAGPAPDPFPANEEWYEKSQTAGDIHIPRA